MSGPGLQVNGHIHHIIILALFLITFCKIAIAALALHVRHESAWPYARPVSDYINKKLTQKLSTDLILNMNDECSEFLIQGAGLNKGCCSDDAHSLTDNAQKWGAIISFCPPIILSSISRKREIYRLENWNLALAPRWPYFFLSLARGSRLTNPARFNG